MHRQWHFCCDLPPDYGRAQTRTNIQKKKNATAIADPNETAIYFIVFDFRKQNAEQWR